MSLRFVKSPQGCGLPAQRLPLCTLTAQSLTPAEQRQAYAAMQAFAEQVHLAELMKMQPLPTITLSFLARKPAPPDLTFLQWCKHLLLLGTLAGRVVRPLSLKGRTEHFLARYSSPILLKARSFHRKYPLVPTLPKRNGAFAHIEPHLLSTSMCFQSI